MHSKFWTGRTPARGRNSRFRNACPATEAGGFRTAFLFSLRETVDMSRTAVPHEHTSPCSSRFSWLRLSRARGGDRPDLRTPGDLGHPQRGVQQIPEPPCPFSQPLVISSQNPQGTRAALEARPGTVIFRGLLPWRGWDSWRCRRHPALASGSGKRLWQAALASGSGKLVWQAEAGPALTGGEGRNGQGI